MKIRRWLQKKLECQHRHGFRYTTVGGKPCLYYQCECIAVCSIPVYEVFCPDCKKSWTLAADALIDFFAVEDV